MALITGAFAVHEHDGEAVSADHDVQTDKSISLYYKGLLIMFPKKVNNTLM